MRVVLAAGARPNFMKVGPIWHEMHRVPGIDPILVHTGQHYDPALSEVFLENLEMPLPAVNLEVGSASHAVQTAEIMSRLEPVLERERPDLVVVVGDVNSSLASALTAVKMQIPVAHVEAGLRSFDRSMPEEINRVLVDAISDYLFTTEESGNVNLRNEGISEDRIFFVGNVMIDSLMRTASARRRSTILQELGLKPGEYAILTLHRPSNVDQRSTLESCIDALAKVQQRIPIAFPMHPRTRARLKEHGLEKALLAIKDLVVTGPLGYIDFLKLLEGARIALTDSGGIQEECVVLKVRCLTLRETTERPVTVESGFNTVVGCDWRQLVARVERALTEPRPTGEPPPLWDGQAAKRIVRILQVESGALGRRAGGA